ncbi:MAG: L,D-transpeptidase [Armatimonadota bacterium]
MGNISAKRILIALMVVTVVILTIAGGFWVYMNYFTRKNGGPGTKIVNASDIPDRESCVFSMPGDPSRESKPLEELLPSGWKRMNRRIVVDKSSRTLNVYTGKRRVKSYFIALGYRPEGPKAKRDDGKTPEGVYYVCSRNPRSNYELSLLIAYPGKAEADNGLKNGLIDKAVYSSITSALSEKRTPPQDTALGSYICIHGGGIGELASDFSKARINDWTQGCIAMRSEDIEEVYDFADPGTTVEIRP